MYKNYQIPKFKVKNYESIKISYLTPISDIFCEFYNNLCSKILIFI